MVFSRKNIWIDGESAQADAGRRVQRVAEGRRRGGHAGLADAAWGFAALDQVNLDSRSFVDSHHAVVVEIALLYSALVDGDIAVQGGGQPEYQAALQLRDHRIRIDDDARVHHAHQAMHADLAAGIDLRLGDRRNESAECHLQRDAAARAAGQGASPARLLRGEIERGLEAG